MTAPKAARSNRYGSRFYPIPDPSTGEAVELPGASSLGKLLAAPGLETWKLKAVARQLARKPDLILLAGSEDTLYSAVKQAMDADQSAANTGTAVHSYCEQFDNGTLLDVALVPEGARGHFDQYVAAAEKWRWETILNEQTVYNFEVGYAGTLDRVWHLPGIGVVVADIKTGGSVYAEVSLQLAALANAEGVWVPPDEYPETDRLRAELAADMHANKMTKKAVREREQAIEDSQLAEMFELGQHLPMPDGLRQDLAVVIHLRTDSCDLLPIDLEAGWEAVKALAVVRGWQAQSSIIVGHALTPEVKNDGSSPSGGSPGVDVGVDLGGGTGVTPESDPASTKPAASGPVSESVPSTLADSPPGEPPAQLELDGRRTKVAEHIHWLDEAGKEALANNWPAGVPGFRAKPWTHTVEQLDAIEAVIGAVEATTGRYMQWPEEAPRTEVEAVELVTKAFESPVYANTERQPLIDRVQALPEDLQEVAAKQAKECDIPNLRSTKLTKDDAVNMAAILTDLERKLAERNTVKEQGALL